MDGYKGSKATKEGQEYTSDSHYERKGGTKSGHEKGGIKGSKKGIKNSFAGRHLHETEHHNRMEHNVEEGYGFTPGDGATA